MSLICTSDDPSIELTDDERKQQDYPEPIEFHSDTESDDED